MNIISSIIYDLSITVLTPFGSSAACRELLAAAAERVASYLHSLEGSLEAELKLILVPLKKLSLSLYIYLYPGEWEGLILYIYIYLLRGLNYSSCSET